MEEARLFQRKQSLIGIEVTVGTVAEIDMDVAALNECLQPCKPAVYIV